MPGTDLNITLPTVATDTWPVWANGINAALTTIVNDLEPQVVTSEINETSDHAFNGYAATDLKWLTFRVGNSLNLPAYGAGFKEGNFWIGDGSGNQIQVTAGGALLAGGNGFRNDTAYAYYTAASTLYEFKDVAGAYAIVKADQLGIQTGTFTTTVQASDVANWTLKLPPNDPASGVSLLTLDSLGAMQLAESAAVSNPFTVNAVQTFTVDPVLSGTTKVKHGDRVHQFPPRLDYSSSAIARENGIEGSGNNIAVRRLELQVGWRVKSMKIVYLKNGTLTTTAAIKYIDSAGTIQAIAGASITDTTAGTRTSTITPTSPFTVTTLNHYYLHFTFANSSDFLYHIEVTYDVI